MLTRLEDETRETVSFTIDGRAEKAQTGDVVAAALLLCGVTTFRTTPLSGAPRAPYCMMGVCFECLVTINGVENRQACLIEIEEGMTIQTQVRQPPQGKLP